MNIQNNKFRYDKNFPLTYGESLNGFEIAYTTIGTLNANKDNVIWICHAMTGGSDFTDWWDEIIGEGIDYSKYFVVCANMLGSCYGSTGPLSINPKDNKPYYHSFPKLSTRDCVHSFDLLREYLGIQSIHLLIGGSMGGQQTLDWAILRPDVIKKIVPIACNAKHSPWGIAFNASQRMAIEADATWAEKREDAGKEGLKAARAIAVLSFRHYDVFAHTQSDSIDETQNFKAESYMRYHGVKLVNRFNAFSYMTLTSIMDSHNVALNRCDSLEEALGLIKAETLVIGIESDILFPVSEQQFIADHIPGAELKAIKSLYGHDGFLKETEAINHILKDFI